MRFMLFVFLNRTTYASDFDAFLYLRLRPAITKLIPLLILHCQAEWTLIPIAPRIEWGYK